MRRRNGKGQVPDPGAQGRSMPAEGPTPADGQPLHPQALDIQPDVAGESSDTLTLYLREVRRTELFTAQEEYETARRARGGDFPARQSMIEPTR